MWYLYIINIILCLNLFQPLKTIHIIPHSQASGACLPAPAVGPREAGRISKRFYCSGRMERGMLGWGNQRTAAQGGWREGWWGGETEDRRAERLRQRAQHWPREQGSARDGGGRGSAGAASGRPGWAEGVLCPQPFPGGRAAHTPWKPTAPPTQSWPQLIPGQGKNRAYADRTPEET